MFHYCEVYILLFELSETYRVYQKLTERDQLTLKLFQIGTLYYHFILSKYCYTRFDTSNFRYQSTGIRSTNLDVLKYGSDLVSR